MLEGVTGVCTTVYEDDGQFLSRGALARMALEALEAWKPPVTQEAPVAQDAQETANDFDKAVQMGLLIGFSDGNFYPDRPATLAEAATVVCRVMDRNKVTFYEDN